MTSDTQVEKQHSFAKTFTAVGPWLRRSIGFLLAGLGLWLVTRHVDPPRLLHSLRTARWAYALLGLLVILVTIAVKARRWQMLFYPAEQAPPYGDVVKALVTGYFLNLVLPIARTGDVARLFLLDKHVSKAQALGTLVVEKALDMIMLGLTLLVLLPFIVIPDMVVDDPFIWVLMAGLAFIALYLLAYQTRPIIRITRYVAGYFPAAVEKRIVRVVVSGLEGLAALRDRRTAFSLLLISAFIALLSALTPFVIFGMFRFDLGLAEAAVVNLTVLIGSLPSAAPANIGVFEWLTTTILKQFGLTDDSVLLSYALIYHLVVVLPVIVFGSWGFMQGDWRLSELKARVLG